MCVRQLHRGHWPRAYHSFVTHDSHFTVSSKVPHIEAPAHAAPPHSVVSGAPPGKRDLCGSKRGLCSGRRCHHRPRQAARGRSRNSIEESEEVSPVIIIVIYVSKARDDTIDGIWGVSQYGKCERCESGRWSLESQINSKICKIDSMSISMSKISAMSLSLCSPKVVWGFCFTAAVRVLARVAMAGWSLMVRAPRSYGVQSAGSTLFTAL